MRFSAEYPTLLAYCCVDSTQTCWRYTVYLSIETKVDGRGLLGWRKKAFSFGRSERRGAGIGIGPFYRIRTSAREWRGGGFASEKVAGGRGLVGGRAVGHGWKTKLGRCGTSKTPEMRDRADATARCGEEDGRMAG